MADFKIKSTAGTGNKTLIQSQDQSGSSYAIQVGDAGATTLTNATITAGTFPAGHVLQFKEGAKEATERTTTTNELEIFGSDATIVPKVTGSRIFVFINIVGISTSNDSATVRIHLTDGTSNIRLLVYHLLYATEINYSYPLRLSTSHIFDTGTSYTAGQTYSFNANFKCGNGTHNVSVNNNGQAGGITGEEISTIFLMEVAQ